MTRSRTAQRGSIPPRHLVDARLAYLTRHWWAWNKAAVDVADAFYRAENTSVEAICAMAGLHCPGTLQSQNRQVLTANLNSHGGATRYVTWDQLFRADSSAASLALDFTRRLGYQVPPVMPPEMMSHSSATVQAPVQAGGLATGDRSEGQGPQGGTNGMRVR
eukprot:3249785-Prymnesium_polylepis.1